jgi:peptidyl-prolyl cis-trans isomerase A (cyclophilin A)
LLGLSAWGLAGCESAPDEQPNVSTDRAPESYRVRFETTKGDFTVKVRPEWAPQGAKRFRELVESGFYDGARFFRVVPGFMVQFGISGDPKVSEEWREKTIPDDPVTQSNQRGYVTFATSGPDSRTTQVFINYGDNAQLDGQGFSPFGVVTQGMDVVDAINAEYREEPNQQLIQEEGNAYLDREFPNLDSIKKATIIEEGGADGDSAKATGSAPSGASGADGAKDDTEDTTNGKES